MTSTNVALNDVILAIVLEIVLFAAMYYAVKKPAVSAGLKIRIIHF